MAQLWHPPAWSNRAKLRNQTDPFFIIHLIRTDLVAEQNL